MSIYRRWPSVHATPVEVSDPAHLLRHLINVGVVAAVLSLAPVTRATGIPPATVFALVGSHLLWTVCVMFVIRPSAASAARFHVALAGTIVLNTSIVIAFSVLGGEPRTPLWMLPVMYACFNGSMQSLEPSLGVLLIHVAMPLLAIPVLLARGADTGWSVVAPVLCSAASAVAFNHLAQVSAGWRSHRRENDALLAELRARLDEDGRARLARDVHDGLGSSLAFVGLYGDLIERHADRPDELRAIAAMVRDAACDGGTELASLIAAITPDATALDAIVSIMVDHAQRAALSSGIMIDIRTLRGGTQLLEGSSRLALVRVFQESLNNALRHGNAKQVTVEVAVDVATIGIDITDDGKGFDAAAVPRGRGLDGMRARAFELGGELTVSTAPGHGARIRMTLPRTGRARA